MSLPLRVPRSRAWWCAALGLAACGADEPEPLARLRLWTLADGELVEEAPPSPHIRLDAPGGPRDGWETVLLPDREGPGPLVRLVDGSQPSVVSDEWEEDSFVRLEGAHGGLHLSLPAIGATPYRFNGRVRANGLETDAAAFEGAGFWIAEARAESSLAELLARREELLLGLWSSASARGRDGWQTHERLFVTHPETRVLHLVCSLAGAETVRAGSVDFSRLRLRELPFPLLWRDQLSRARAARDDVDPPASDWQRARRTSALVGGEHRPAIVLLPGDRLTFALPPLAPGARLELGVGPWLPASLGPRSGRTTLRIRAGSDTSFERAFELGAGRTGAAWEPLELDLGPDPRMLELALQGDGPLALGSPLVRTEAPPPAGPNVLIVSIDTLRSDHVGAYGYPLATTPNLDRLAKAGLLCRDASAPAPYTLPSHATLLSGQFPSVHGVVERGRALAAARSNALAETLARAGYATQAFTSGGFVKADFGLDRGFDAFAEIDPIRARDSHYFRALARRHGEAAATRLLDSHGFEGVGRWLADHASERFLLFLHTYAVHDYDAPERFVTCQADGCPAPSVPPRTRTDAEAAAYTAEMRAHIVHLYDAALRYTDERLGELFAVLERLGLADDTLIVVTSDHGEEFFEHGHLQHGRTLYEELLAIPLLFHGPGIPARELARPAMLVDVVPTVLARLGLPRDSRGQGLDLLGPDWPARPVWSEVEDRFAHKYALRHEDGRKTIHGPPTPGLRYPNEREWERYELARDAREQQDLARATPIDAAPIDPGEREALLELRRMLESLGASFGELGHGEIGAETEDELDGLGYAE